jgi:thiol:disulfide interchange protein DsbA
MATPSRNKTTLIISTLLISISLAVMLFVFTKGESTSNTHQPFQNIESSVALQPKSEPKVSPVSLERYIEGEHYYKLDEKLRTNTPMVVEMFSYYCPHCFGAEKVMRSLKAELGDAIPFKHLPVTFMRGISEQVQDYLRRVYIYAQDNGIEEMLSSYIFDSIHVRKKAPKTIDDVNTLLKEFGLSAEQIQQIENSTAIAEKNKNMGELLDLLSQNKEIKGVPSLIVNGVYLINFGKLGLETGNPVEKIKDVVVFLSNK